MFLGIKEGEAMFEKVLNILLFGTMLFCIGFQVKGHEFGGLFFLQTGLAIYYFINIISDD